MADLTGLICGDELLVDGNSYTGAGTEWARLTYVSPGSASVYPYKVLLSNGASGQYAPNEILDRRRPASFARNLDEIEKSHPGFIADLEANARWPR